MQLNRLDFKNTRADAVNDNSRKRAYKYLEECFRGEQPTKLNIFI